VSDNDKIVVVVQSILALGAIATCVGMWRKALNFHPFRIVALIVFFVATAVLTAAALLTPLYFFGEGVYAQSQLRVDLLTYGMAGLFVVGIMGFYVDHMRERPNWLLVGAAACLSIALFPLIYLLTQDSLHQRFQIKIVPESEVKKTVDP
jgi:hypothetical protein